LTGQNAIAGFALYPPSSVGECERLPEAEESRTRAPELGWTGGDKDVHAWSGENSLIHRLVKGFLCQQVIAAILTPKHMVALLGREHPKAGEEAFVVLSKVAEKVAKVVEPTNHVDIPSIILKVKKLASEVGGMGQLKAMVEALSQ
jgi:hypothetical protein